MSERTKIALSEDEVTSLVGTQRKLQLGTINPDGTPHMVTMFHAVIDGQIAFWTYRSSQKARNIARDPRVTCLIEAGEDYFELSGALIYGRAEVVTDPNRVRYVGSEVVRRMMDLTDDDAIAPFVEATAAKRHAYLVEPVRVASWDHRKLT
ncbi:pyridoxamine 5'-phosphate oxidase family protein [Actinomadura barringtoniae]|uniref:Pyridoxamine 5'-phosphate oxidase family protein n=1 Tax=Actinomadura barringtoniae TaxID=1427535 RepID=A0A939PDL6_9ACTN|nr:pyridoxamine 5'-phosphate oxidase family protein [Actinomadura barringtoniae]MBO2450388.1 pyridoxamine 5'-phosphate oxidase family protein [Actinomadura barringtoniae]